MCCQLSCWKNIIYIASAYLEIAGQNSTSLPSCHSSASGAHCDEPTSTRQPRKCLPQVSCPKGTRPKGRRKERAHVVSHLWKANPSPLHSCSQAEAVDCMILSKPFPRFQDSSEFPVYSQRPTFRPATGSKVGVNRKVESGAQMCSIQFAISAGLQTNHCDSPGVVANCQTCIAGGYLDASHMGPRIHKWNFWASGC